MAIHVQDEETDWMVREFARKRGVGITAAIKLAIEEATRSERQGIDALTRRIEPILAQIRERRVPIKQEHLRFVGMIEDAR